MKNNYKSNLREMKTTPRFFLSDHKMQQLVYKYKTQSSLKVQDQSTESSENTDRTSPHVTTFES